MIAELSQLTNHFGGAPLCPTASDSRTTFFVSHAFVLNHPDQAAQTMSNGSDSLRVSEAYYDKPTIDQLKDAALGFNSSVRRLIEQTPHLTIAFG